jgi:Na+/H+-translocating membrane pyrophosphatase
MANSSSHYVEETGIEGQQGPSSSTATPRNNHLLFYKLCDTRKAVLIVNAFNILAILISVIFKAVVYHELHFGGLFSGLFGIILSVIGLFGAIHFDVKASGLATLGFAFCFLMDFIRLNLIGVLIDALLVYPHAYFTYEVYRGVMVKETYKKDVEYLMPGIPDLPDV